MFAGEGAAAAAAASQARVGPRSAGAGGWKPEGRSWRQGWVRSPAPVLRSPPCPRPPGAGLEQWCGARARAPRPPSGRRGSGRAPGGVGRETPPAAHSRSLCVWPLGPRTRLGIADGCPPGEYGASARVSLAPRALFFLLSLRLALLPGWPRGAWRVGVQLCSSGETGSWPPSRTCPLEATPEQLDNVHSEQIQKGQRDHSRV